MRFFRTPDAGLYEMIRLQLDAAWGHPTPDGRTLTCFDPAAVAPRDEQSRILLAVHSEFAEYPAVAAVLPGLLASGAVEEISEATYLASLPQQPYDSPAPPPSPKRPAGPLDTRAWPY